MKIQLSYLPGEDLAARTVEEWCRGTFPGVKVRESDRHPPFKHIYMTTKKPETPCDSKENA